MAIAVNQIAKPPDQTIPGTIQFVTSGTLTTDTSYMDTVEIDSPVIYVTIAPTNLMSDIDFTLSDMPTMSATLKVRMNPRFPKEPPPAVIPPPPAPNISNTQPLVRRVMPSTHIVMSTPVIVRGRPTSPKYWASNDVTPELRTDPGHIQAIDNPDPKWDPNTQQWNPSPPDGGVGDVRWTVNSLPDPALWTGAYPLGTRSSKDGTGGLPAAAGQWDPDSSTPTGPSWHSRWPFKPVVAPYIHHNTDGSTFEVPRGVHFHSGDVDHMWATFSRPQDATPFTWIIIALVFDHNGNVHRHPLLDWGQSPYNYWNGWDETTNSQIRNLPGNEGAGGVRTYLAVDQHSVYMSNKFDARTLHVRHPSGPKPKMYWGIWNGTDSYVGCWFRDLKYTTHGKLKDDFNALHKNLVMGRLNGIISPHQAADMMVFEVRYWRSKLTMSQIHAQYAQLSSTWQFHLYQ